MVVDDTPATSAKHAADLDSVEFAAWPSRAFPIQGSGSRNVVQVILKRSVLNAIREHGLSRTDVEVCGVLVGNGYRDERGPFVYVEATIKGDHSDSKIAQVTFTAETWNHIQNEMDRRFEQQRILGWYHTHPGFGIFLSPMDMFIHDNFFNANEQLALVYDPLGGDDGLFVWRGGKAIEHQYLIEEDVAKDVTSATDEPRKVSATAGAQMPESELAGRLRHLERRQTALTAVVALLAALVLSGPWLIAWVHPPSGAPTSPVPQDRNRVQDPSQNANRTQTPGLPGAQASPMPVPPPSTLPPSMQLAPQLAPNQPNKMGDSPLSEIKQPSSDDQSKGRGKNDDQRRAAQPDKPGDPAQIVDPMKTLPQPAHP